MSRWPAGPAPEIRFWAKVDKNGPTVRADLGPCWLWTGSTDGFRYGGFFLDGRLVKAHRYSWSLVNGEIPGRFQVLHRCDNPPCVKPAHLFLGTQLENVHDAKAKGRLSAPPVSTRRGAENPSSKLSEENVREIRRLYVPRSRRLGARALARRFGVSWGAVRDVVNGRNWRHVA